ncbi:MAG TPA: TIR domain-containing protein [Candidatus Solibacter sp.]|nr:TIR domain-containing protein [Candidatus Solibacter sp.]
MRFLEAWKIEHRGQTRTIELWQGDLTKLPADQAVDILVVSAFPGDYTPTPGSLIGALHQMGLSVADLAKRKAVDMRKDSASCWLSKPVPADFNFKRVLCVESPWDGAPHEIADTVFRAMAPLLVTDFRDGSVAMPLIRAGDAGAPEGDVMRAIVRAGSSWIGRGLAMPVLKIVVYDEEVCPEARRAFVSERDANERQEEPPAEEFAPSPFAVRRGRAIDFSTPRPKERKKRPRESWHVFLSYSHNDRVTAEFVKKKLESLRPGIRIFYDRTGFETGESWLMRLAKSLDAAERVVAIYTPAYWESRDCNDEFTAALSRQTDTGDLVLFPIYLRSARIPYLFRNLEYFDCREGNRAKVNKACAELAKALEE